jgi:hypothetical protein
MAIAIKPKSEGTNSLAKITAFTKRKTLALIIAAVTHTTPLLTLLDNVASDNYIPLKQIRYWIPSASVSFKRRVSSISPAENANRQK